jgi:hypothetical protein
MEISPMPEISITPAIPETLAILHDKCLRLACYAVSCNHKFEFKEFDEDIYNKEWIKHIICKGRENISLVFATRPERPVSNCPYEWQQYAHFATGHMCNFYEIYKLLKKTINDIANKAFTPFVIKRFDAVTLTNLYDILTNALVKIDECKRIGDEHEKLFKYDGLFWIRIPLDEKSAWSPNYNQKMVINK